MKLENMFADGSVGLNRAGDDLRFFLPERRKGNYFTTEGGKKQIHGKG